MNHYTYFIILFASISIPLIFSFEKRVHYFERWKEYFIPVTITALLFLIKDAYFTYLGIWGFNKNYITGIKVYTLPIEEILFFFCIPYASLFIHEINNRFNIVNFRPRITYTITVLFIAFQANILILHGDKTYTWWNAFIYMIILLVTMLSKKIELLRSFYGSFLGIIIPFIIVNGILTGMLNVGGDPVVWYEMNEILGIRIGSIPVEDVFYGFSMLFLPILIRSTVFYQSLLARFKN